MKKRDFVVFVLVSAVLVAMSVFVSAQIAPGLGGSTGIGGSTGFGGSGPLGLPQPGSGTGTLPIPPLCGSSVSCTNPPTIIGVTTGGGTCTVPPAGGGAGTKITPTCDTLSGQTPCGTGCCGAGTQCDNGGCIPSCTKDTQTRCGSTCCAESQTCDAGACKDKPCDRKDFGCTGPNARTIIEAGAPPCIAVTVTDCSCKITIPLCPNGRIDPGENCYNCPVDAPCGPGLYCDAVLKGCLPIPDPGETGPVCGNGACEAGETKFTCTADCGTPDFCETTDPDNSRKCCEDKGFKWAKAGETIPFGGFSNADIINHVTECIGDDAGEFYRFKECEGTACTTDTKDDAGCSSANSCVLDAKCYSRLDEVDKQPVVQQKSNENKNKNNKLGELFSKLPELIKKAKAASTKKERRHIESNEIAAVMKNLAKEKDDSGRSLGDDITEQAQGTATSSKGSTITCVTK